MPNPLRSYGGSSFSKNSSTLDIKNEGKVKEETTGRKGSGCKNVMSAAQYRAILLQGRGREDKKSADKKEKKKKMIVRLKVGNHLSTGVKKSLEIDSNEDCLEEGEIRPEEDTVPHEPEEAGRKLKSKVCEGLIKEECCEDVQPRGADRAVLMAETGSDDDNVCVICKLGGSGKLLCCDRKSCKNNYHLKCLDPPLKDMPPGGWRCVLCVKKKIQSGVHSLPGGVKSNLDAKKVDSVDSKGLVTTKNNLDSSDCVMKVEEKHVRASASKFLEYCVPVKLSNVQLEQYCNILLSNSALLRSCSKNDTVEALRDVITSTRKCCDHPYFVDPSLQKILTNGLPEAEYLSVGIKASGKLQVLDKILSETKKQGLRAVIIFQSSGGSSEISLGDVLDDVVCQRCGVGSYERVDCGLIMPNKQFARNRQAAVNRFNDKEKGRIVFLLDRRACHSSIKLLSVDIVILYDSDLNPYNDLKVLQKITIDSHHEQLKVFRLYSLCTLEEMVVIHAEQGVTVDAQNLNHSTIHQLLRWGASNLFNQLAEFHGSSPSSGPSFSSDNLVKKLFGQVPQDAASRSIRDIPLPGDLEMQSVDDDLPHVFWTKLLNRKTPKWRYLPAASSKRIRRRGQFFEGSLEKADLDNVIVPRKRRKVLTSAIDVVEDKRKVGDVKKEGKRIDHTNASAVDYTGCSKMALVGTPAGDCSQFLTNLAVPTAARSRKAVSSVIAAFMGESVKISAPQELKGEIKENHQSPQTVLPPPSEPPCPEPIVADQIVLVNNSASGSASQPDIKLDNGIQFGHTTSQHAKYPTLPLAELPSHNAVVPLEKIPQLSISVDRSPGGNVACVSPSRSMGGDPDPINHPRQSATENSSQAPQLLLHRDSLLYESVRIRKDQNQVGLVTTPQPNTQLGSGILPWCDVSQPVEFPAHRETAETHSDGLQIRMPQLPMIIDKSVGGSVTRVSDFRSLGVVPDRISHPLQIAPLTSSQTTQTSQTLPQDDPLLYEVSRIRREREQAEKFHEELKMRIRLDFFKEVQETNRKYSKLHHDNDAAFARTRTQLHTNYNKFLFHRMLAEAFRDKCCEATGAAGPLDVIQV